MSTIGIKATVAVFAENTGRYHANVLDEEDCILHTTASLLSAHAARCAAETWMEEGRIENVRPGTPSTAPETPADRVAALSRIELADLMEHIIGATEKNGAPDWLWSVLNDWSLVDTSKRAKS